mgnify:CR=1 FL=1
MAHLSRWFPCLRSCARTRCQSLLPTTQKTARGLPSLSLRLGKIEIPPTEHPQVAGRVERQRERGALGRMRVEPLGALQQPDRVLQHRLALRCPGDDGNLHARVNAARGPVPRAYPNPGCEAGGGCEEGEEGGGCEEVAGLTG